MLICFVLFLFMRLETSPVGQTMHHEPHSHTDYSRTQCFFVMFKCSSIIIVIKTVLDQEVSASQVCQSAVLARVSTCP